MPRKSRLRTAQNAYHLTSRSNNQEWFYLPIERAWVHFRRLLPKVNERYGAEIHAFVLMSNHFHLILSTPHANVDQVMRYFLTEVGRGIRGETGRSNHVFGNRYHSTVLPTARALAFCLKYVARNPVRANLVDRVEEYAFSSFHPSNASGESLSLCEGLGPYWSLFPKDPEQRSEWLNSPTPKEHEELIGKALRRREFQFSRRRGMAPLLRDLHREYQIEPEERDQK